MVVLDLGQRDTSDREPAAAMVVALSIPDSAGPPSPGAIVPSNGHAIVEFSPGERADFAHSGPFRFPDGPQHILRQ